MTSIIACLALALILNIPAVAFRKCSAFAEVASAADALFELGQEYYEEGNYKEALHELKKALLANPEHIQAFTYIQLIEEELGLSEEEIEEMTREEVLKQALEEAEKKGAVPFLGRREF